MSEISLGKKLAKLRTDNRITVKNLARLFREKLGSNTAPATIRLWERDKSIPNRDNLNLYHIVFKVNLDDYYWKATQKRLERTKLLMRKKEKMKNQEETASKCILDWTLRELVGRFSDAQIKYLAKGKICYGLSDENLDRIANEMEQVK